MSNIAERERFEVLQIAVGEKDYDEVERLIETWPEDGQEHAYHYALSRGWQPEDRNKWSRFWWSPTGETKR